MLVRPDALERESREGRIYRDRGEKEATASVCRDASEREARTYVSGRHGARNKDVLLAMLWSEQFATPSWRCCSCAFLSRSCGWVSLPLPLSSGHPAYPTSSGTRSCWRERWDERRRGKAFSPHLSPPVLAPPISQAHHCRKETGLPTEMNRKSLQ